MIITDQLKLNEITQAIIGSAIEVHKLLGPGLLERVYHECLYYELKQKKFYVQSEPSLAFSYKDSEIGFDLRPDLIVEESVIVELKAVTTMHPVFEAQLLSYLKLTGLKTGLLINFWVPYLKKGIIRRSMFDSQASIDTQ